MPKKSRNEAAPVDTATKRALESLPPFLTPHLLSDAVFGGAISEKTLSRWRLEGKGPVYLRRGHPTRGRILYATAAVAEWLGSLPAATTTTSERLRVEKTAA